MAIKSSKSVVVLTGLIAATFTSGSILVSLIYLKNSNEKNRKQTIKEYADSIKVHVDGNTNELYASYISEQSFVKENEEDENYSYSLSVDKDKVNDKTGQLVLDIIVKNKKKPSETLKVSRIVSGFKCFDKNEVIREGKGLENKFDNVNELRNFLNSLSKSYYGLQKLEDNGYIKVELLPQSLGVTFSNYELTTVTENSVAKYVFKINYKVLGELKTYENENSLNNKTILKDNKENKTASLFLDISKFVKNVSASETAKTIHELELLKSKFDNLLNEIQNSKEKYKNDSYDELIRKINNQRSQIDSFLAKPELTKNTDLNSFNDKFDEYSNEKNMIDLQNAIEEAQAILDKYENKFSTDTMNLKKAIQEANQAITNHSVNEFFNHITSVNENKIEYINSIENELENSKKPFKNWKTENEDFINFIINKNPMNTEESQLVDKLNHLNELLNKNIDQTTPLEVKTTYTDFLATVVSLKEMISNAIKSELNFIEQFKLTYPNDNSALNLNWNYQLVNINDKEKTLGSWIDYFSFLEKDSYQLLNTKLNQVKQLKDLVKQIRQNALKDVVDKIKDEVLLIKPLVEKLKDSKYDTISDDIKNAFDINTTEGENYKNALDFVNNTKNYLDYKKPELNNVLTKLINDKNNLIDAMSRIDDRDEFYKHAFEKAKNKIETFELALQNDYKLIPISSDIQDDINTAKNNLVDQNNIAAIDDNSLDIKLKNIEDSLKAAKTKADNLVDSSRSLALEELNKIKEIKKYVAKNPMSLNKNDFDFDVDSIEKILVSGSKDIQNYQQKTTELQTIVQDYNSKINSKLDELVNSITASLTEIDNFKVDEVILSDVKNIILNKLNSSETQNIIAELTNVKNQKESFKNDYTSTSTFSLDDTKTKLDNLNNVFMTTQENKQDALNAVELKKESVVDLQTKLNELITKAKTEYKLPNDSLIFKNINDYFTNNLNNLEDKNLTQLTQIEIKLKEFKSQLISKMEMKLNTDRETLNNKINEAKQLKENNSNDNDIVNVLEQPIIDAEIIKNNPNSNIKEINDEFNKLQMVLDKVESIIKAKKAIEDANDVISKGNIKPEDENDINSKKDEINNAITDPSKTKEDIDKLTDELNKKVEKAKLNKLIEEAKEFRDKHKNSEKIIGNLTIQIQEAENTLQNENSTVEEFNSELNNLNEELNKARSRNKFYDIKIKYLEYKSKIKNYNSDHLGIIEEKEYDEDEINKMLNQIDENISTKEIQIDFNTDSKRIDELANNLNINVAESYASYIQRYFSGMETFGIFYLTPFRYLISTSKNEKIEYDSTKVFIQIDNIGDVSEFIARDADKAIDILETFMLYLWKTNFYYYIKEDLLKEQINQFPNLNQRPNLFSMEPFNFPIIAYNEAYPEIIAKANECLELIEDDSVTTEQLASAYFNLRIMEKKAIVKTFIKQYESSNNNPTLDDEINAEFVQLINEATNLLNIDIFDRKHLDKIKAFLDKVQKIKKRAYLKYISSVFKRYVSKFKTKYDNYDKSDLDRWNYARNSYDKIKEIIEKIDNYVPTDNIYNTIEALMYSAIDPWKNFLDSFSIDSKNGKDNYEAFTLISNINVLINSSTELINNESYYLHKNISFMYSKFPDKKLIEFANVIDRKSKELWERINQSFEEKEVFDYNGLTSKEAAEYLYYGSAAKLEQLFLENELFNNIKNRDFLNKVMTRLNIGNYESLLQKNQSFSDTIQKLERMEKISNDFSPKEFFEKVRTLSVVAHLVNKMAIYFEFEDSMLENEDFANIWMTNSKQFNFGGNIMKLTFKEAKEKIINLLTTKFAEFTNDDKYTSSEMYIYHQYLLDRYDFLVKEFTNLCKGHLYDKYEQLKELYESNQGGAHPEEGLKILLNENAVNTWNWTNLFSLSSISYSNFSEIEKRIIEFVGILKQAEDAAK
ncbi:rhoptry family protein [Mycoplasmopsis lipofaciens]|uniref:hypothetical protein n=1 Tax=Mycoplasmopsis lipofaciens TaxID=114884 RepID=UPI00047FB22C|nr:hypothetical protein [Mycoplasmopsis lipofaciens]